MKIIEWLKNRASEASSHNGLGLAGLGLSVLLNADVQLAIANAYHAGQAVVIASAALVTALGASAIVKKEATKTVIVKKAK